MKKPKAETADDAAEGAVSLDQLARENGGDRNDARWLHPSDPDFAGQGLDLSVYGKEVAAKSDEA